MATTRRILATQKERAHFPPQPYLLPTEKGGRPACFWGVDTIVGMSPPHPSGATAIIVAVCLFSKWMEWALLRVVDSRHAAAFLHESIVCRYGTPAMVRTDRGSKYRGAFSRYCQLAGI